MKTKCIIAIIISCLCSSSVFSYEYHLPIEKYKLSNGLTVILEEDHNFPLVDVQLWVATGSCYEGKFLGSGITHFVEHMVFKGKESSFSTRVAKQMRELGGELDAATSKEYTHFDITVKKDNIGKTLELLKAVITGAGFVDEDLNREREVVLREMDTVDDDPHKFLVQSYLELAFQGHPYGDPVIGYRELFKSITKENMAEYYTARYTPRNMVLVLTGDFESVPAKKIIDNLWGQIYSIFSEPVYIPKAPSVIGPVKTIILKDISSAYIITGFYGPSIKSKDMYPMDVLAEIAGGSEKSPLVKKLRDRYNLVSNIDAWSSTPTCTGIWGVNADLIGSDWKLTLKNTIKEVYKFREKQVSDKELLEAKKRIIHRYISSLETIEGRASDLGVNEIYTKNPLFSRTYISGIKNVSKEDIIQCAKKYFNAQNNSTAVLIPAKEKLKKNVSAAEPKKEISKIELSNGLKILVKEDDRLPLVTIRLAGIGGLLEEGIPGLSYFTSQLWFKENLDLVNEIESHGGSINTYSGNNSIGCNAQVFKEDLPLALNIIKKMMQGLSISDEKMDLVRSIQLAQIRQEADSPYGFAFRSAKKVFFNNHPYKNSIIGNEESVLKINKESAADYFNKYIKNGNLVIGVFGDVNTKEIDNLIKEVFSHETKANIEAQPLNANPIEPKINRVIEPKKTEQAIVILAYPGVSIYSEDRYAVELLTKIFSGQAGRLFENIRESEGLSYSVGALDFMGREQGSFMFYISTIPGSVETAKELLLKEITKIKTEGVTNEELERVKNYYLTQTQKEWESIEGLSLEAALDELYGLGFNYYKTYPDKISKVTPDDIKNTANKYFRDDWYSLVTVGPVTEAK